jgi:hypothetical protein
MTFGDCSWIATLVERREVLRSAASKNKRLADICVVKMYQRRIFFLVGLVQNVCVVGTSKVQLSGARPHYPSFHLAPVGLFQLIRIVASSCLLAPTVLPEHAGDVCYRPQLPLFVLFYWSTAATSSFANWADPVIKPQEYAPPWTLPLSTLYPAALNLVLKRLDSATSVLDGPASDLMRRPESRELNHSCNVWLPRCAFETLKSRLLRPLATRRDFLRC